jgi:hypothetical protein
MSKKLLHGSDMDLLRVPPKITRGMGVSISSLARSEDEDESPSVGLEHQHTLVSKLKNTF